MTSGYRSEAGPTWPRACAALIVLAAGLALAPVTYAGDDFERGFKNELGRIAAHEAVGVGQQILGALLLPRYGQPYGHAGYHRYGYGRYGPPYGWMARRHYWGPPPPCGGSYWERVEYREGCCYYERYERGGWR
jgi:hypothetical protein